MSAGPQLRLLGADRSAAEDGHDIDAAVLAVGAQGLGDLDAELARGRQHERLHLALLGIDVLDNGQSEGRRLAGAGLRLPDHVAAFEQRRDGLFLDRAGRLIADVAQRMKGGLGETEIGEGLTHSGRELTRCKPSCRRIQQQLARGAPLTQVDLSLGGV